MTGALRINPRMRTAKGPAKIMAKAGRQSKRGFDVISESNNPNHGAMANHEMISGKNTAATRGKKDVLASPCDVKPMMVTMARARMSPRMRMFFFMRRFKNVKRKTKKFAFYVLFSSSFLKAGNNNTSRMECLLISTMARRSTPMPNPPLGGMP